MELGITLRLVERRDSAALTLSALCGLAWAAVAIGLIRHEMPREGRDIGSIVWEFRGGVLAAPLIGVAAGYASRHFRQLGFMGRTTLSLVVLYGSAFLFFLTALSTSVVFDGWPHFVSFGVLLSAAASEAFLGLTLTGWVLVLGHFAYWNCWFVSRSTSREQHQD